AAGTAGVTVSLHAALPILVGLAPAGDLGGPVLLLGRAVQGLSAACILPASLALVKAWWEGAARQRAISLWSIGTWGGAGFSALRSEEHTSELQSRENLVCR